MKQFVKLNRNLNENDVGKRVKLRNGDIDEISSFSKDSTYPLHTKHNDVYTKDGKYWNDLKTHMCDIVEIEEEVQSEDGLSMSSPLIDDNGCYENIRVTLPQTTSYTIELHDNCLEALYVFDDVIIRVERNINE